MVDGSDVRDRQVSSPLIGRAYGRMLTLQPPPCLEHAVISALYGGWCQGRRPAPALGPLDPNRIHVRERSRLIHPAFEAMREQAHPVERVSHTIVRPPIRRLRWTRRVCLRQGVKRDRFELGPTGVDQQPGDGRHQRDPIIGVNSVPDRP